MPPKIIIAAVLQLLLITAQPLHAAITLDGTLGRSGAITGPNYAITSDLGKQAGTNLFHSFSTFNLVKGDIATFSGPTNISNIISRVTGGSASSIDGTLKSTISDANMYFLNPAGVIFGPNSSLDISGSFHVSTADYLKFPEGNLFVDPAKSSTFSTATPEAFGFLGTNRASITVKDGAMLAVKQSQAISIVGGDIEINNGEVSTEGGEIRVVALGQKTQEIALTGALPAAYGNLVLSNCGVISSNTISSGDAGSVKVSAGSITIDNQGSATDKTGIFSVTQHGSTGTAGSIDVSATGNIAIVNGGKISANTAGINVSALGDIAIFNGGIIGSSTLDSSGDAGSVKVSGGSITIDGQGPFYATGIFSEAYENAGKAGSIEVTATGNISILNGGEISFGTAFTTSDAGSVKVSADSITIDGRSNYHASGIFSDAGFSSSGNAGSVEVTATGNVSVVNGGQISSTTFSSGDAGSVRVRAGGISIDGQGSYQATGIFSDAGEWSTGKAGSVEVTAAGNISIADGGYISSDTFSSGDAGTVKVRAGNITIDGLGNSSNVTGIASQVNYLGNGKAGSVDVTATGNISILNGGIISTSTFYSYGDAGTVKVSAGSITIDGQGNSSNVTGIVSETDNGSTGKAGSVEVTATGKISIVNGGQISTNTFYSSGDAGSIKVSANSISIDGQGSNHATGIFSDADTGSTGNAGTVDVSATGKIDLVNGGSISSSTGSPGNAGLVKVSADIISIVNGGQITSSTFSSGDAGKITVETGKLIISGGDSGISSSTYSYGSGGSISIKASDTVSIADGAAILSVAGTGSKGNAGNIIIESGNLNLSGIDSGISSSTFSAGNGGSVSIKASDTVTISNGGVVASVAQVKSSGNAGNVTVEAGDLNISGNKTGISSSTFSDGNGGIVFIKASDTVSLAGGAVVECLAGSGSKGTAGNITVETGNLIISGSNASISSSTYSVGNGGSISIKASDSVSTVGGGSLMCQAEEGSRGDAGKISIETGKLIIAGIGSGISSSTYSDGSGGSISIKASDTVSIADGGAVLSVAGTGSKGNAGNIIIESGNLNLSGIDTGISSSTFSVGNGGSVSIKASDRVNISNGGVVASIAQAKSSGNAGNVSVEAGNLNISGTETGISSSTFSDGNGGSISIKAADSVSIADGGSLASESTNTGRAGEISIIVKNNLSLKDSSITTATLNAGGGSITIDPVLVHLKNSSITTSVKGGTGNGGNIDLTAKQLVVDNSRIVAQADAGNGGNINLNADVIIQSPTGSLISASSNLGLQGTVVLSSPVLDVNAALVEMPSSLRDIASLSPRRCITTGDEISSFVVYSCGVSLRQADAALISR